MFEKMLTYKKAWGLFCKWLKKKYCICVIKNNYFHIPITCRDCDFDNQDYEIEDDFILSIMPFFFDEYEIFMQIRRISKNNYMSVTTDTYRNEFHFHRYKNRMAALIPASEKAFEILEDKLT
jgi:hypothetical protein